MKFRLDQTEFGKFRKALLIRTIPVMLLPLIGVLIFNRPDATTAIFMIPFFVVILTVVMWYSIKKQKLAWNTFELNIDDVKVERIQEGFPSISVLKKDVKEVIESKNGSITLITKPKSSSIIIPFGIENRIELIEVISDFATIRKSKNSYGLLLTYGAGVFGLLLFFSFMLSTNFYLAMASGITLFALCLWSLITTLRNKNIDKKVKRLSFVILILLLVILYKLFGMINQYYG